MSVEAVQSACRAYMHDLHALKREVNRELDRAQEAAITSEHYGELWKAWDRVQHARRVVIETISEHHG